MKNKKEIRSNKKDQVLNCADYFVGITHDVLRRNSGRMCIKLHEQMLGTWIWESIFNLPGELPSGGL
jgi:hypothetical protein